MGGRTRSDLSQLAVASSCAEPVFTKRIDDTAASCCSDGECEDAKGG